MGVSRSVLRRAGALALTLGVVLASFGGVGAARAGSGIADPAGVAAGWVAARVEAGGLGASQLADAIFALAAAHAGAAAAGDALVQLKANADVYMGYGATLKPGAVAKVMLAVTVAGSDPTSFNGHNLESDLRGLGTTSGADAGRFTGAQVYDQALAILALASTSAGVPAGAGDWLASRQCTAGDYAWDGTCPVAAGAEDPDTTSIALQALLAAGNSTAAAKAVGWLVGRQASNGALASYGMPNSTSTAATAEALRAAGNNTKADAAAAWVATLQYGCGVAKANRGAIPWTAKDPGYGGPFASTAAGALAFGAGRLDTLRIAGASAMAPTLTCAAVTPAPTVPPTDAVRGRPASSSDAALILLGALAAMAGSVLLVARRPAARH
jgi:hypothetical protein